jgi:hypothetical protein
MYRVQFNITCVTNSFAVELERNVVKDISWLTNPVHLCIAVITIGGTVSTDTAQFVAGRLQRCSLVSSLTICVNLVTKQVPKL